MPCSSSVLGAMLGDVVTMASVAGALVSTAALRLLARGFFVAVGFAAFSAAGSFVFARDRFAGVPGVTSIKHLLDKIVRVGIKHESCHGARGDCRAISFNVARELPS